MKVDVMQFLMPDGRQRLVTAELPDDLADQYDKMKDCLARFTAEMLSTGEISVTIESSKGDDFDIRVVKNGPEVQTAMADMLRGFCVLAYETWYQDQLAEA